MAAGRVLLSPVVIGYKLGMISASRGRQVAARVGFQGEDAARMRRLGVEYATTTLPAQVRQSALDRIAWHRSRGDQVVIVSASLDLYLSPWCRRGLDCICTTLEERDGRLTGRCVGGDCAGLEKSAGFGSDSISAATETVYAYGDSGEDREMLELAHRKFYRWEEISSWDQVRARSSTSHAGRG